MPGILPRIFPRICPLVSRCLLIPWLALLATSAPATAQGIDFSQGFLFAPAGTTDTLQGSFIRVPGSGSYDAVFRLNPQTLALELQSATPSQTDERTAALGGLYTCHLFNGTVPIFSTTIRPMGQNLVFGGGLQYQFIGYSGTTVSKYTVSFADGGKYLLSMVKETDQTYGVLGYLPPGQTDLDSSNALRCEKKA